MQAADHRSSRPPADEAWYDRSFGPDYLRLYAHRDQAEARQGIDLVVRRLGLQPAMAVLDLCCGAGRHLFALAERGFGPVGLDRSSVLLGHARQEGWGGPLIRSDMRHLPLRSRTFDCVVSFFTSFGYFPDDEENARVLVEGARVLRPGGALLLDYLNREHVLSRGLTDSREEREGMVVEQQRRWNRHSDTVDKTIRIFSEAHPGEHRVYRESVKLYAPDRVLSFFRDAGLKVIDRVGSLAGESYQPSSPRLIVLGRKEGR